MNTLTILARLSAAIRFARRLVLPGLLLGAAPAWALELQHGGDSHSTGAHGGYPFEVVNNQAQSLTRLDWRNSAGYSIDCDARTRSGAAFGTDAGLAPGDRVACIAKPTAQRRQGVVLLQGWQTDGASRTRALRFDLRGALTPDQGIVAVLAGGIHDDANEDGVLDAGEVIDYHYTVVNLGNLDLSALALTDLAGPVSCPAAVLAVGASMVCQRSHAITAAEDGEGEVINSVEVTGDDANGGPVQAVDLDVHLDLGGSAGIGVIKSPMLVDDADASGYASAGDVIGYTFVVKNTRAWTLDPVDLVEPDPSLIDGPITCAALSLAGAPFTGPGSGVLAGLDTVLCQASHTITLAEAAAGEAANLVEASGQPPVGAAVSATGASLVLIPTPAQITVSKALTGESGSVPGVAEPGETLTYTITLDNPDGIDAIGVGIIDLLDANTVFVSADNGGTHAGGQVTWTGLTVPANGNLVLTVQVTVANPVPVGTMDIANVAHEAGTTPPDCPPAGDQCVVTPVLGTVTLAKAVADANGNGQAEPGETLTYTITLTNTGGSNVSGIGLTDPLDGNTTFVSASHGGSHAGGVVTWSGLTVPAGGNLVLSLVVTVNSPLPAGAVAIGNLVYDSGGPPVDCSATPTPPNCATIPTSPAISLVKSVVDGNGNGQAEPGETLTYTIALSNSGGSDATSLGVTDVLDANTTFVSADNDGSHAAGVVTWSGLAIPAGGNRILTVQVTVNDPLADDVEIITNLAHETGTVRPDCSVTPEPQACASIPVQGVPAVAVSKTASSQSAAPGGSVTYTVLVANVGTVPVSDLQVNDPLPAGVVGFTWTCSAGGGAACPAANGSGAIVQTIASLPVGGSLTYTVVAQVGANPPDPVVNLVTVTPAELALCQPEGTPSPCQAEVPVTIETGTPPPVRPVPVNGPWGLVLMAALMLFAASRVNRRRFS